MKKLAFIILGLFLICTQALAFEQPGGLRYFHQDYSGDQDSTTIRTPASGSAIAVWGYVISTDTATRWTFNLTDAQRGGEATVSAAVIRLEANTTSEHPVGNAPIFTGDVNRALTFSSSSNGATSVTVIYSEIP